MSLGLGMRQEITAFFVKSLVFYLYAGMDQE